MRRRHTLETSQSDTKQPNRCKDGSHAFWVQQYCTGCHHDEARVQPTACKRRGQQAQKTRPTLLKHPNTCENINCVPGSSPTLTQPLGHTKTSNFPFPRRYCCLRCQKLPKFPIAQTRVPASLPN